MKKLFFGIEMKWWKVIVFAVVTGVYTGIIMQIHALDGTSFQDIGISYEWWILFAVIIAMNCEKPVEAACKIFVFFLISQPLVYLTMWPEYHRFPWEYYAFWGKMTVLTLPGGYICWQVKRQNVLSALVLSVACGFLAMMGVGGLWRIVHTDGVPYGLLTALFCLAQAVVYIVVLMPRKREKLIVTAISVLAAGVFLGAQILGGPQCSANYILDDAAAYTYTAEDESLFDISVYDDMFDISANKYGSTVLTATGADGSAVIFDVTITPDEGVQIHRR